MPRIDAHHHLWRYNEQDFSWISDDAAALRRDFLPTEFAQVLADTGVDAAVAVQSRCLLEETKWLLACAETTPQIAAVVGWVPLTSGTLSTLLDQLSGEPRLAGFREIVQDQPPGFLLTDAFNRGMLQLTARGLTYDLLIRASQLDEAIRFVDLHPNQSFVLDHAAKPLINFRQLEPWRADVHKLAERPNVLCKLSGLVTEAHWQRWTEHDLYPYLDTCLQAFGPTRCMVGSDWPVCLTASSYRRWWQVLERWSAPFSSAEQEQILGGTAAQFYGCDPDAADKLAVHP